MQALVERFAQSTIDYSRTSRANERNRLAKMRISAFESLVEGFGDEGRDALAQLLTDGDRSVRCFTASYLLRYRTEPSLAVLCEIARGNDLAAFEAQCSIRNWRDGSWQLDPGSDATEG